jgi:hypothetical protein
MAIGKFSARTEYLYNSTDDDPMNNETGSDIKGSGGGIIRGIPSTSVWRVWVKPLKTYQDRQCPGSFETVNSREQVRGVIA